MSKVYKSLKLLILILVVVPNSVAQTGAKYTLDLKPKFRFKQRAIPIQIVGEDESNYYILYAKGRYGRGARSIVKFKQDLTPTESTLSLAFMQGSIAARSLGTIKLKGKLADVSVISTSTFKRYTLRTIDLEKLKIIDTKTIANIVIPEANVNKSFARFITSRDDSCIALFYTIPTKRNQNVKFSLIIFDNDLNQIGKYNYELPYLNKNISIRYISLLNADEAILFTSNLKTKIENVTRNGSITLDTIRDYNYTLIFLNNDSHKIIARVPNDNNWFDNPTLLINDTTITVLGYYGRAYRYHAKGIFYYAVDRQSGQILLYKFTPFSSESREQHIALNGGQGQRGVKWGKKRVRKHQELPYYVPFDIIHNEDSTMTFIGEQFWTESYNYSIVFYYKNLMLLNLNQKGDINWSRIIKKDNSKSNTPIYSHYYLLRKSNDDLILLYNGNSLNLKKDYPQRHNAFTHPNGKMIMAHEIRKDGQIDGTVISSATFTENYIMRPRLSRRIDKNKLLLFAQNMDNVKQQRFMVLTIPEE